MNIKEYFKLAIEEKASDLHIISGSKPVLRVNGELKIIEEYLINQEDLSNTLKELVNERIFNSFLDQKEADFSLEIFEQRFRVNLHFQKGLIGLSARLIKKIVPSTEELGLSATVSNLAKLRDGLVLFVGPTGSGKSTSLASLIESINQDRAAHIITVEDPIEYVFTNKKSIIEQREVGSDTYSFANALKHILRQDPNVIMIGEMRDLETMSIALTAAETGHLVLSNLHTNTAAETISRIVDSFPPDSRQQILLQLSSSLRAIVAQQLLPKTGGGLIAAREVLINNQAASNLIRNNNITQIQSVLQTGQREGMVEFNKNIEELLERGLISINTAANRRRNVENKATYY
jgi:twitching motility protein PilT